MGRTILSTPPLPSFSVSTIRAAVSLTLRTTQRRGNKKNRQIRRLAHPVWVVICQQEPGVPKRALNVSNRRRSANPPIAAHVTNVTTRQCDHLSRHTCAL